MSATQTFRRSFLKWPGGKYRVLHRLIPLLPPGNRLIEPFAGSCVVSINADFPEYILSDANGNLVETLDHARSSYINVGRLRELFSSANNNKLRYDEFREEFNSTTDCCNHARLFIYLNRHCFNGLWRVNNHGKFNVPFGKYKNIYFPEVELNYFASKFEPFSIAIRDFAETMGMARSRDVIYCDPPYVPFSATANFTSYIAGGFSINQHRTLANLAIRAASRGATVLISNHDNEITRELYRDAHIVSFEVQRSISAKGSDRKKVKELIAIY